ncbi:hypothetical protein J25TS5_19820 [Paenibacillus faecis]|uniref:hypothetical protein n=1 Tax=Paenibacillus faecis TaxID=862114 RepID=UPI001B044E29|nr:hypothetical protein [Paenibacillus faecis]GIO85050.1 hypothetical protein J25TS5_19820 [Paenibacillus faecis]
MYDDNELMALVQAGDQQAYEKLVLKYRLKAIAFANPCYKAYSGNGRPCVYFDRFYRGNAAE